jgi:hypothetical protein
MPSVSIDSRSLLLGTSRNRASRLAIVAATFDPSLVDPARWRDGLRALRHAGFNAVVIRVPWCLHEPTPGRFVFDGACDLRAAVTAAGEAGLRVLLRIGPCVGGTFAGGGLPGWISDFAGDRLREANPAFLERVTRFWHALAAQCVDLQATRNGNGAARPIVAVGIEDDWRCLDADVGAAYFAALVRFARERGFDVPLFTANNCWYTHEGVLDAWEFRGACHVAETAHELREVQRDMPPLLLGVTPDPQVARAIVAARADAVLDVVATRHRGASSCAGGAEKAAVDLFPLRRLLAFASTFGPLLAGLDADAKAHDLLRGPARERVTVAGAAMKHVAADGSSAACVAGSASGVDFFASDLPIAGARLERCSASLVAVLDDLVVVAGKARGRVQVRVDGSSVALTVPAEGSLPKVTKVRGLRIAAVPFALADGIGVIDGGFEFVDRAGVVLARVLADGSVSRPKVAASSTPAPEKPKLSESVALVEKSILDGTHPRFAGVSAPRALGSYGVASIHGYYRCIHKPNGRRAREFTLAAARSLAVRAHETDGKGRITLVHEVRACGLPAQGPACGARIGAFGPLLEVAPLKGVRCETVDLPDFDPTRLGRFVHGYDARVEGDHVATLRWTFAPRTTPVLVRFPQWWLESVAGRAAHRLRLNDALVPSFDASVDAGAVLLEGALLTPMRPKKLAKGEKPPKAKAVKLEPGPNELLLDLHGHAGDLKRLAKEVAFLEVVREEPAEWAFLRVEPPAIWAGAKPAAKKPTGAPTWFRTTFTLAAPQDVELEVAHAPGAVSTVLVHGAVVLACDGTSGVRAGKSLVRRATIAGRAGLNEIAMFSPDGTMPAISVR